VGDDANEPRWPVDRYSQHRVCDCCGRSFDELAPHQVDVRVPTARKLDSLRAVVEVLRRAGYSFVTLGEAARRLS